MREKSFVMAYIKPYVNDVMLLITFESFCTFVEGAIHFVTITAICLTALVRLYKTTSKDGIKEQ